MWIYITVIHMVWLWTCYTTYNIFYLYSYKKTELLMMVCVPSYNIGRPIYIWRIGRKLWQFWKKIPSPLSIFANKASPRSSWCFAERMGILLVLHIIYRTLIIIWANVWLLELRAKYLSQCRGRGTILCVINTVYVWNMV